MKEKQNISRIPDLCAVISASDHYNFEKFSKLNSFSKILKTVLGKEFADFWEFSEEREKFLAQIGEQDKKFGEDLFKSYDALLENGLLSERDIRDLKGLFAHLLEEKNSETEEKSEKKTEIKSALNFTQKISLLQEIADELLSLSESETQNLRIEEVLKNINERSFSIGITGVMNAGKSTFLNAILRSSVLGTAVVPETANLTILKYSKKPYAVVNFWNKEQWNEIEKSGKYLPQIEKFVKDTKNQFGEKLDDFVTEDSKKLTINIDELAFYTSAIKSDMKCNLVQSVELYTNLEFLKDGVSIVDTPGLDDPVTKREEITRGYLNSCDMMLHLMNANQSATEKDVNFIIDALTYQGISRLLVVITRIDTITKDELKEVIEYTKNSIKNQLDKHNKSSNLDGILSKLEFMPIAGKLALMHRTGEADEAEKLGYTEEQTGIFEIENFLNETLFGENNPKANLLIASNAKTLNLTMKKFKESFLEECENLGKSSEELSSELENVKTLNEKKESEIDKLLLNVQNATGELNEFGLSLLSELGTRVNLLKNRIFSRVYDDIKYGFEKNKKRPENDRLNYIIESGIKDGMIDLIRDCRYEFSKKSVLLQEKISALFDNVKIVQNTQNFDVKAFFESQPNGVNLTFSMLISRFEKICKKCSKSNLEEFANEFGDILTDEFSAVKKELETLLSNLNSKLIGDFAAENEKPLTKIKEDMEEETKRLKKQIDILKNHAKNADERKVELDAKLQKLENLKRKIVAAEENE